MVYVGRGSAGSQYRRVAGDRKQSSGIARLGSDSAPEATACSTARSCQPYQVDNRGLVW
jgi:hypothetical protein